MTQSATHHWLSIDCWTCELRSDTKQLQTTMQCRSHSRRRTIECLFVTACSMVEYAEENRKKIIVRSGISEAKTTNNKRLRSTFCIEAIAYRHQASRGLFVTAELLVTVVPMRIRQCHCSHTVAALTVLWQLRSKSAGNGDFRPPGGTGVNYMVRGHVYPIFSLYWAALPQ